MPALNTLEASHSSKRLGSKHLGNIYSSDTMTLQCHTLC